MLYSKEDTPLEYEHLLAESLRTQLEMKSIKKIKDITGGVVNKAALYETNNGKKVFVKYAPRNNVSAN